LEESNIAGAGDTIEIGIVGAGWELDVNADAF
jgi:hypothetical protein